MIAANRPRRMASSTDDGEREHPFMFPLHPDDYPDIGPENALLRGAGYVAVTIVAFIVGVIIGQLEGSRVPWSSPAVPVRPHPRSLQP